MASLKDLRGRISSVKATRKITKAMQMVAAAKLRRAQDQAEAARPYAEQLQTTLERFGGRLVPPSPVARLMTGTGRDETHLLVIATGERGLAGAFNSNIVRLAREQIRRLMTEGKTVKIMTVGRKGADQIRRDYEKFMIEHVDLRTVRQLGYVNALDIAQRIMRRFERDEFDVATLYFSKFVNIITQRPQSVRLIPLDLPASDVMVEFEPDEAEILLDLLPGNLASKIYSALLENNAGFYASQMTAMDNATRNAGDMVDRYTLEYNRARQAMITKELIEIISGAEAI